MSKRVDVSEFVCWGLLYLNWVGLFVVPAIVLVLKACN